MKVRFRAANRGSGVTEGRRTRGLMVGMVWGIFVIFAGLLPGQRVFGAEPEAAQGDGEEDAARGTVRAAGESRQEGESDDEGVWEASSGIWEAPGDLVRVSPSLGELNGRAHCIGVVELEGLSSTRAYVVERELRLDGVQPGAVLEGEEIEEAVQRLRNMGIFRKVSARLLPIWREGEEFSAVGETPVECDRGKPTRLRIMIDEQWTALPIFNYSQGGGTFRLRLGAYDENFLGRYLRVGAQYERLGDANSFFAWGADPRLFGQRLLARLSVGQRNQLFYLYEPQGYIGGGFLLRRFLAELYVRKEWLPWLRFGGFIHFDHDDFTLELLEEEIIARQKVRGLPERSHALFIGVDTMIGRFNWDNYLIEGAQAHIVLSQSVEGLGSSYSFTDLNGVFSAFKTLPFKSTLGLHLAGALTAGGFEDSNLLHRRYYLGGLDSVRGFESNRFNGHHFWLSSVELRVPSLDTRWLVLQHIAFVDTAGAAEKLSGLARVSGASAGVGIRIIVPKIKDLIVRFDYAFGLYGDAPSPMSLGGGQFF